MTRIEATLQRARSLMPRRPAISSPVRGARGPLVVVAALILGVLVAQVAVAGSSDQGPRASASGPAQQKAFRNYKRKTDKRIAALEAQVNAIQRQPGPQGPEGPQGPHGPAGSAPACTGNGSGDAMVAAGSVCIDRYEVSVWSSPTGGTQYGATSDDYPCDDNGQNCTNIYARSVPGVTPSRFITWFQAQQALANVGKRLPSNAEWQQAVAGAPDPGPDNGTTDCKTAGAFGPVNTGSRSACVSRFGAFDMVGNLDERVGDWVPASTATPGWGAFSNDVMGLSGASTTAEGPGSLIRGGDFSDGMAAGPFAVGGSGRPSSEGTNVGFRGAR